MGGGAGTFQSLRQSADGEKCLGPCGANAIVEPHLDRLHVYCHFDGLHVYPHFDGRYLYLCFQGLYVYLYSPGLEVYPHFDGLHVCPEPVDTIPPFIESSAPLKASLNWR